MKKTLRSIFTLCLSLVFVITLCPCFSVMAATDLSTLTAEALAGKQVPTAITADLTLPTDEGITWSSSNPDVISNTGVVTRPLAQDANVTLTATLESGEAKTFNFIVKSKNKNVVYQESFNFTGLENTTGTENIYNTIGNEWAISSAANKGSKIVSDSTGNKYLEADMSVGNTVLYWKKAVEDDVIYLDFDVMRANAANTVALQAYVTGTDKDGTAVTRLLRLALFYDGKIYWGNNANSTGMTAVDTAALKTVSFKIDLANKKFYGSYNGGEWTEVDSTNTNYGTTTSQAEGLLATDTISGLSYLRFLAQSSGADNIMLDNFVLSTDAELTAAEALSLVSADSLAGEQALTAITTNLTIPEHNGITWSSNNPDVISNTGVVTRPLAADSNVTMTATTTDGESVSFDFTVKAKTKKVLASENFAAYSSLTNENHDTNIFSSMTYWGNSTSTGSHILNNYLEVGFDKNPSTAHQIRWNISPSDKVLYFDIDFKRDEKGMPFNLQAYFSAQVNGTTDQKLARFATIYDGYVYWGNNASGKYTQYTLGYWHTLSFKIDMNELKTYGSLDGGEWTEIDMLAYYGGNFNVKDSSTYTRENTSINYMQRIHFALNSGVSTNVMLDNLVLSTDAFSVTNAVRDDETGIVSAVIGNAGIESLTATAICAGYQGDKLIEVELMPVTLNAGNNNVTFTKSFAGATTYSVYLWNSLGKLIPLSTAVGGSVSE